MDRKDALRLLSLGVRFSRKNSSESKPIVTQNNNLAVCSNESAELLKPSALGSHNNSNTYSLQEASISLLSSAAEPEPKRKKPQKTHSSVDPALARHVEEINRLRKLKQIHVYGTDVSDPVNSFSELKSRYGISEALIQNLSDSGFSELTPVQMQAIPLMLERREVLVSAPTGSGKTLAFVLPVLHLLKKSKKGGFRAVIVSPTKELAKQIYREFLRFSKGLGIRIYTIKKRHPVEAFSDATNKRLDVLVTTPNRLIRLLFSENTAFTLHDVEFLIVDESDKLFEAGERGFRDQMATIYKACDNVRVRRALFSATFNFEVEEWCKLTLDNLVLVGVGPRNSAVQSVDQKLLFVGDDFGKIVAFRNLLKTGIPPPVLVFAESIEKAKKLHREISNEGIHVDIIHSQLSETDREAAVKRFREGSTWILICTELLGRGIDFKSVKCVVNYDFPQSAVSYIHKIGRTGRAGRKGMAITFFTEDDAPALRSIANVIKQAGCPVPEYMLSLKKQRKRKRKMFSKPLTEESPAKDANNSASEASLEKKKQKPKRVFSKLSALAKKSNQLNTTKQKRRTSA